jgi:outer membrane protein assembly factor BamA
MVRFDAGHVAPWSELSDGYHAFIALIADIARRAVMLNEIDGGVAPERVEGVVLIDEIDLHLHPRWQRVALGGLRRAFPRLQLVVTTHSPQVLSSAENRQVRRLVDGRVQEHDVFVQGRDSNAILRELMRTDDRDEEGTSVTSLVSFGVTRDSRDSTITPTRGGQSAVTLDVAGLGGDSQYVKAIASTSYFKPIWFNHVLSGRAEVGYGFGWGDEELPLFERFFLGGPNSVRSFKSRRLSPTDDSGTRIGGNTEVLGNVEYLVPLPFNLRLAGFVDIGNAFGFGTKFDLTELREAAGAGVRWISPFGPIRLDYGVNIDRRKGEDFGAFHFSVGTPF